MQTSNTPCCKQVILEYWTMIEFFSPYSLDGVLNSENNIQKIFTEDKPLEQLLPWSDAPVINEHDKTTPFAKG